MSYPRLSMRAACGREQLLGIDAGRAALPGLLDAADALPPDTCAAIDFAGIDMVTASAARESVLRLVDHLADRKVLAVLVAMNLETRDEVEFAAEASRCILVTAESVAEDGPVGVRLLGSVDEKVKETLGLVAKLVETDARTANEACVGSSIGATAWNNRLAALAQARLLRERKVGKTKYYSLALKGLVDGN